MKNSFHPIKNIIWDRNLGGKKVVRMKLWKLVRVLGLKFSCVWNVTLWRGLYVSDIMSLPEVKIRKLWFGTWGRGSAFTLFLLIPTLYHTSSFTVSHVISNKFEKCFILHDMTWKWDKNKKVAHEAQPWYVNFYCTDTWQHGICSFYMIK